MKSTQILTADEVIALLRREAEASSIRKAAAAFGVSSSYLYDAMAGKRRLGPRLLKQLGLEKEETRTVVYRRVRKAKR